MNCWLLLLLVCVIPLSTPPPCLVLCGPSLCPSYAHFRENAEAIAFYGGDAREASDLLGRLLVVLDVLLRRIAWLGGYELWLVVYR